MDIFQDETYFLEILVTDKNGEGKSGLTVSFEIFKSSDNSSVNSGTLNDLGNGVYKSSFTFNNLGQFRIVYNTPSGFTDEIETIFVRSDLEILIKRILGLSQENYRLISPVYDSSNNLLSAKIKTFSTASDVDNNTNEIAEYEIEATYDSGLLQSYKVKKI